MTARIVQIMPATGWYAAYGDVGYGDEERTRIDAHLYWDVLIAWALCDDGEVRGLVTGLSSEPVHFADDEDVDGFLGYAHRPRAAAEVWNGEDVVQDELREWERDFRQRVVDVVTADD